MLVIGLCVGSLSLLPSVPARTFAATGSGTLVAVRSDHGLELRLSVPAGPFFATELLPITLTLTNRSSTPATYHGTPGDSLCGGGVFDLELLQQGRYVEPLDLGFAMDCPPPLVRPARLPAGAALSTQFLRGLPDSGRLTLTAQADLSGDPWHRGGTGRAARFAAGWPTLTMLVNASPPKSAALPLVRRGHTVFVRSVPPHLVGEYLVKYPEGQGGCITGMFSWYAIPTGALSDFTGRSRQDAECAGATEEWQVLVGAPGYAISRAVYCFHPAPDYIFSVRSGVLQLRDGLTCTERAE